MKNIQTIIFIIIWFIFVTDCGLLAPPASGSVNLVNGTKYGAVATFSCTLGYDIFGSRSVACTAEGRWLPVSPTCKMTGDLQIVFTHF